VDETLTAATQWSINPCIGARRSSDSLSPWSTLAGRFRIYSRALRPAEIQESFATGAVFSDLLAKYDFDGSGTTLKDSSGNGHDGTIRNVSDPDSWRVASYRDGPSFADGDDRIFNIIPALVDQDLGLAIYYIGREAITPFSAAWAGTSTHVLQAVQS